GTYYICDLLGCNVTTDQGRDLGEVKDIIKTGSNDVRNQSSSSLTKSGIPYFVNIKS
ncbi:MAG: PRC-barrel domain-containing protein, partial [Helicobacter sp.]|nr:PRC-barrel domain-containing protein [Helicobacter sp.]